MNLIEYVFSLNDNETIIMQLVGTCQIAKISYDTFANIFFCNSGLRILLTYDMLHEHCLLLNILCKKALCIESVLNDKEFEDLGLLYNTLLHTSVYIKSKDMQAENRFKNLRKYVLWSPVLSKNNMKTWMYNDIDRQIVLFIAPVYPFTFSSKRVKGYVPYEQWIKTYKPFVKRVISPTIIQEWIKQTDEIIKMIHTNVERKSQ